MNTNAEKISFWHKVFEWALALKGFNGAWETISGILFLFVSKNYFRHMFLFLTRWELLEDPHDKLATFLSSSMTLFSNAKVFAGVYILTHGILNIFLVIQLARNRHWAYLVTIGVSVLFLIYQVFRIINRHSYGLIIISVVDIFFMWLTWREYKFQMSKQSAVKIT